MSPHSQHTQQMHRKEKRILFVEDEPAYRAPVLSILRKAGFQCTFCVDGDHAMRKLSQEKFDFLITDYLLPGPNGVDVLKWVRKQGRNVPTLIITNYLSDELVHTVKSLGQARIVSKQAQAIEEIPKVVQEMLGFHA
jgi:DNA-binding response OmpR family regulator